MNEILVANSNTFNKLEKNVLISVGEFESFQVDFLIKKRNNVLIVEFLEPQRAIASGQSVVFYLGPEVLGGGVIR